MAKHLYVPGNQTKNPLGSRFTVVRPGEPIGSLILSEVRNARDKVIVVIGGGNKGLTAELIAGLPEYISKAFSGFAGTVISGGTGGDRYEITTAAPHIAAENEHAVAIGFTPVTGQPTLDYDSGRVNLSKYNFLDPGHHANVAVAAPPSAAFLDWNGDLDARFSTLEELRDQGYVVVYLIFNGGGVTAEELYRSIDAKFHSVVVDGSLREADHFLGQLKVGKVGDLNADGKPVPAETVATRQGLMDGLDRANLSSPKVGDANALRAVLIAQKALTETVAA